MAVFSGTASTDFMKLFSVTDERKKEFINYAGNDFLSIRDDLINYIKSVYPLDYQNFSESDLGIMLIEVVAYMGAVLSLKADMLANENYLRTVKSRSNLKKLLELIGIDMKAPLAGGGGGKLTIKSGGGSVDFPYTLTPANRVFAIPGEQDGAPVNYTIYKIVNNAIQGLQSIVGNIQLQSDEVDNTGGDKPIFSNIAILEGALRVQQGTFEADEGNKTIALTDSPIVEGSVQVYVTNAGADADGIYTQVERLYSASGATDKIFQVVYDGDYAATLLFGDNIVGISPPPGSTFSVFYRVGGGERGNIRADAINVTTTVFDNSDNAVDADLENRTAITGGSEAETSEHAKRWGPLNFKRQDRVVTLEDFIAIGNTFRSKQGTIGKTTAAVRDAFSSGNIIDLYTLEKASDLHLQKASSTFKKELLEEIEPKKMLTDEVVICDGLIRTLDLVVTVRIDKELEPRRSEIQSQVSDVIISFFNIENNEFGKAFVAADLNRQIYNLSTVRYSTVDNVGEVIPVDFNEIIQLNNFTVNSVLV